MLVGWEDISLWRGTHTDRAVWEKPVPHPHGCSVQHAGFYPFTFPTHSMHLLTFSNPTSPAGGRQRSSFFLLCCMFASAYLPPYLAAHTCSHPPLSESFISPLCPPGSLRSRPPLAPPSSSSTNTSLTPPCRSPASLLPAHLSHDKPCFLCISPPCQS